MSPVTEQVGVADTIGILGLGAMGLAMASCLTETQTVVGYDPDPARLETFASLGGRSASSPTEVAAGSEILLTAVRDAPQLRDCLFGAQGAAPHLASGSTVIVTSTVGRDAVIEAGEQLAGLGIDVVDAPVSGGPVRAASGELLIMVGAAERAFARCTPLLGTLASHVELVGPEVGDGQSMKIVNQLLSGVHIAAAAEALALAQSIGLDPAVALEVLNRGAAASFMLADRGPRMLEEEAEVRSSLDIFVKDMGLVEDLAGGARQPTGLASTARQLYLLARKQGLGEHDDSTIISILKGNGDAPK